MIYSVTLEGVQRLIGAELLNGSYRPSVSRMTLFQLPAVYCLLILTLASAPRQPGMAFGFETETSTAFALG